MAVCRIGESGPIVGSLRLPTEKDKSPASFSRRTKHGAWADTTDFHFVQWIARCCDCYVCEQRLREPGAYNDAVQASEAVV
jgi:hypothetical protein